MTVSWVWVLYNGGNRDNGHINNVFQGEADPAILRFK